MWIEVLSFWKAEIDAACELIDFFTFNVQSALELEQSQDRFLEFCLVKNVWFIAWSTMKTLQSHSAQMSASQTKFITEHEKVSSLPSHHLTSQPSVEILLEHQERYLLRYFLIT